MIAKCFRGQNRDMQKFSWNLDNFKFDAGFEPETYKCKSWHTNHSAMWIVSVFVQYIPRFTRLVELSRMAWLVFKISNFLQFLPKNRLGRALTLDRISGGRDLYPSSIPIEDRKNLTIVRILIFWQFWKIFETNVIFYQKFHYFLIKNTNFSIFPI